MTKGLIIIAALPWWADVLGALLVFAVAMLPLYLMSRAVK